MVKKIVKNFLDNPRIVFTTAIIILVLPGIFVLFIFFFSINGYDLAAIFPYLSTFFPAIAILFSALWASSFAVQNMRTTKKTAKLQETLKLINNTELDGEYIEAKNKWAKYRSVEDRDREFAWLFTHFVMGDGIEKIISNNSKSPNDENSSSALVPKNGYYIQETDETKEIRADAQIIMTYFNHFELVALAIKRGILDEEFYQEWHGAQYIRVWNYSIGAISAVRVLYSNPRLFANWERLAAKWSIELEVQKRETVEYTISELTTLICREKNV